jgi:hypothetical protein
MKRRPFRIGQRLSGSYPNKPQTSQILRERVRPSRRFTEATEEGDPTSAKQAQLEPGGSAVFAVVRFMPPSCARTAEKRSAAVPPNVRMKPQARAIFGDSRSIPRDGDSVDSLLESQNSPCQCFFCMLVVAESPWGLQFDRNGNLWAFRPQTEEVCRSQRSGCEI